MVADDYSVAAAGLGHGGERALRFRATTAGTAHIEAVLRRSWETASPLRRYSVSADVR
jgi:predicted secreted protein